MSGRSVALVEVPARIELLDACRCVQKMVLGIFPAFASGKFSRIASKVCSRNHFRRIVLRSFGFVLAETERVLPSRTRRRICDSGSCVATQRGEHSF
jgi:hypothetical protein